MSETPDFFIFLGRFHPLVVHLPIGFLFFAFILEVFSKWKKNEALQAGIPLALFLGGLSAAVACLLGYLLSLSGDYDESALDFHFWFGILTTIITFLAWLIRIDKIKIDQIKTVKGNIASLTIIVVLLSFTGHYGGNLTHGSDYLTKYAPFNSKEVKEIKKVNTLADAELYNHIVAPILEGKCTSCHNSGKKKGGLMLHDSISIFNGGKSGDALVVGKSSESEMIRRVLLDPSHDDFMPPEGKTPLTEEEIAILKFWIDNSNGEINYKLNPDSSPKEIVTIASSILGLDSKSHSKPSIQKMNPIEDSILIAIQNEGFILRELVFESNLYDVVLPSNSSSNAIEMENKLNKLSKIKDHVLWLSIENNFINDSSLNTISQFKNLQKLVLNSNPITDKGVSNLKPLEKLKSISLYNTDITDMSLESFSKMKSLKKVYAWKTKIKKESTTTILTENKPEIILGL